MSNLSDHYHEQPAQHGFPEYQWVTFDPLTTDEELHHLLAPIHIEEITRKPGLSPMCIFYSDRKTSYAILGKLRAWEKQNIPPRREQLHQKAAARSRAASGVRPKRRMPEVPRSRRWTG